MKSRLLPQSGLQLIPVLAAALFILPLIPSILSVSRNIHLVSPPATPIIEDRYGTFLTEGLEVYDQLGYWSMPEELPERVTRALLVTEDKRFYAHNGVDIRAIFRALLHNFTGKSVQGASTIAMQVARLQNPAPRVLRVKFEEMLTAQGLVSAYGHEAVLRHYMKIVPLGHQIHGFSYAARRYFRKPAADLSWAEAALLAAMPKSPSRTDLFDSEGRLRAAQRARIILILLHDEGDISAEELKISLNYLNTMHSLVKETRPVDSIHFIQRILDQPGIFRDSYSAPIRSSLDLDIQEYVSREARNTLNWLSTLGAGNISVIVLDAETGEILAYLGSSDYFDEEKSGSINYADTPRSSGSILKPFMFAYGLNTGQFTSASILADLPLHWMDPNGSYVVSNFDGLYLGPMLYGNALANSRNITAVRLLESLGPENVYDLFRELGFHDGSEDWGYYGYGMVLGGLYVTLEDVVRAFGYLAGDGKDFSLEWLADGGSVNTTAGASGNAAASKYDSADSGSPSAVSDERGILPEGLLSEDSVRLVTGYLSDPTRRLPSFPRLSSLEFRFPVAIKTGTSQGFRDAWTVGYSRRYVIGAWTGHPDNEPMNHVAGSVIAELVNTLFNGLQSGDREGFDYEAFPQPRNAVAEEVSTLSGNLATADTPSSQVEYFVKGTEPIDYDDTYHRFAIDRRTGRLATSRTAPRDLVTQLYPVLPVEYSAWAAENGMVPPGPGTEETVDASIEITYPPRNARFIMDPTIPARFQTIGLQADVVPKVTELIWIVDGEEYGRSEFPYKLRLPLSEGTHTIQARLPSAFVTSPTVEFTVLQ